MFHSLKIQLTVYISPLGNDYDIDSETSFNIYAVTYPNYGTITFDSYSIIYNPNPNWNGVDSIFYSIEEGGEECLILIKITAVKR